MEHPLLDLRLGTAISCAMLLQGCLSFRPVIVDRKTRLEAELLGNFERIKTEPLCGASHEHALHQHALAAPEQQLYQATIDRSLAKPALDALKQAQTIGEDRQGRLVVLQMPADPAAATRLQHQLAFENAARTAMLEAVQTLSPALKQAGWAALQQAFWRLQRAAAKAGDLVEEQDGRWVRIKPGGE